MSQSINYIDLQIKKNTDKIEELFKLMHEFDKSLALYENHSTAINGYYENINTEVKKITSSYDYINVQLDKVKNDITDIKVKLSDLSTRQKKDEDDKAKKKAFWMGVWKNRTFLISVLLFIVGLYEGGRALYYAESPLHKQKFEVRK